MVQGTRFVVLAEHVKPVRLSVYLSAFLVNASIPPSRALEPRSCHGMERTWRKCASLMELRESWASRKRMAGFHDLYLCLAVQRELHSVLFGACSHPMSLRCSAASPPQPQCSKRRPEPPRVPRMLPDRLCVSGSGSLKFGFRDSDVRIRFRLGGGRGLFRVYTVVSEVCL